MCGILAMSVFAHLCLSRWLPQWCNAGAVFGVAGALAMYHYRHRHVLGEESSNILQSLRNSLVANLKIGLLCPLIDSWWALLALNSSMTCKYIHHEWFMHRCCVCAAYVNATKVELKHWNSMQVSHWWAVWRCISCICIRAKLCQ